MDVGRQSAKQPDNASSRLRAQSKCGGSQLLAGPAGRQRPDHLNSLDVDGTPAAKQTVAKALPATPCTPQECASMVNAVEEAIREAADVAPDSNVANKKLLNLQSWLEESGVRLPTPAAKDLQSLTAAAADSNRLKKQLEALSEAELELAAREAEETAENFAVLEQENFSLAADNARLQQQIAELEALNKAATAAAQQRVQHDSNEEWTDGMEARAAMALQRVEHNRRLSGVYEKKQLASFKQLDNAEEQLSAVKDLTPTSRAQQKEMHRRLLQAEQDVQLAAAAAKEATEKLQRVLDEKEHVQAELQEIKQQLELQPLAQQHADLYKKLAEAQQTMLDEKQEHQKLTGSLLEHAGRLSHKYHALSDDYGALQRRHRHLSITNEQLASQLKEAHEVLFELQATVQATPPAKRCEQQHLLSRVTEAEQAVKSLEREKHQLHERLLQAQAFIACLEQRGAATSAPLHQQQQQLILPEGVSMETPVGKSVLTPAGTAVTPDFCAPAAAAATKAGVTGAPAAAAQKMGKENVEGTTAPVAGAAAAPGAAADTFAGFVTPVKGRSNPLFDLPGTPGSIMQAESAPGVLGGFAHLASFPVEPVSPILAAAAKALSAAAGQQQKQQIQLSAATHELQTVQQEQLGLREEISKAKSALADIAGQLRASIGSSAISARGSAAAGSSSSSSSRSSTSSAGVSRKPATGGVAVHSKHAASAAASSTAAAVASTKPDRPSGSAKSRTSNSKHGLDKAPCKQNESLTTGSRQATQQTSQPLGAASASAMQEFTFPKLSSSEAAPHASSHNSSSSSRGSTGSSHGLQQHQRWSNPLAEQQHQQQVAVGSSRAAARSGGSSATRGASAASGSAKGSLSLDDLIRDAESVSLEYGMSPQCAGHLDDTATTSAAAVAATPPASAPPQLVFGTSGVKTAQSAAAKQQPKTAAEAAARSVALALIENQLTQESRCAAAASAMTAAQDDHGSAATPQQQHGPPETPQSVADSTRGLEESRSVLHQQQEQQLLMQQRLEQCLADTPGSACSSAAGAGGAAAAAARKWLQQQANPLPMGSLLETPSAVQPAGSKAADMQSAVRAASAGTAAAPDAVPAAAATHSPMVQAGTPLGMEGCASNFLGHQSPEAGANPGAAVSQQQQSLLTPSFATPTAVANHRAALAGMLAYDETAADDATSAAREAEGCNESAANMPLQWPKPADTPIVAAGGGGGDGGNGEGYVTPPAGIAVHKGLAPARQQPSAVAAKPSDASAAQNAAAWSTPVAPDAWASEALQSAATALLASISPAGTISPQDVVPAQVLKQLTPAWLKELRQRCQQGTMQVQELRIQLGLATPQTASHAPAAHASGVMTPAVTPTVAEAADKATSNDDIGHTPSATNPAQCSMEQGLTVEAVSLQQAAAGAAVLDPSPVSNQAPGSSLSQASSRSNIDKLRRRAMVQAAAAAAATTPTADTGSRIAPGADTAAAALAAPDSHEDLDRSDSAGSLAQYMQQQEQQPGPNVDSRFADGQQESVGVSPVPYRPGCPTPGSAYSAAATPPTAGSPDMMLAGLSNSRKVAKQLQEQLQWHLGKTAAMPNIFGAPSIIAGAAGTSDAPLLADSASVHDGYLEEAPAGGASNQLSFAPAGPDATPAQSTRTSSRLAEAAAADSFCPGLLPEASPVTPGAALNANAESRMLSPGVQLDQLFEASVSQSQRPEQEMGTSSKRHSSYSMRHDMLASLPVTPADAFDVSSSALTLPAAVAIAATRQPDNDAAVSAHPTPAHSGISTAATSAPHSIRAHPLNSLAAVTQVTSCTHGMLAQTPCLSDAAYGQTDVAAAAAPSSSEHGTPDSGLSVAANQLSAVPGSHMSSGSRNMPPHAPCTSAAAHVPAAVPVATPPASAVAAAAAEAPSSASQGTAGSTRSVAAHQLLSVPAGTHVTSGLSLQALTPCLSDAACGPVAVLTAAGTGTPAAAASSVSHDPSLGSWVGCPVSAAPGNEVVLKPANVTPCPSTHTAETFGAATLAASLPRTHAQHSTPSEVPTANQAAAAGGYVILGYSPSSWSSMDTPAVGAAPTGSIVVPAESSQAFSVGTPSSCCTSQVLGARLGTSPDTATSARAPAPATHGSTASATSEADNAATPGIASLTAPDSSVRGGPRHMAAAPHSPVASLVSGHNNASHALALDSQPVSRICAQRQQREDSTAAPTTSQVTAPQPAVSSCTDVCSCRYATPAMDFATPGASNPEVYFTGLQHTSRSVSARPSSACNAADPVAFGGFSIQAAEDAESELAVASPAPLPAAVVPATSAVVGQSLLQQLLASPSSTCASVAGSPAWAAAAAAGHAGNVAGRLQQQQPQGMAAIQPAVDTLDQAEGPDVGGTQAGHTSALPLGSTGQDAAGDAPSAAIQTSTTCSRGSQTPAALNPEPVAVDQQIVSHALPDVTSAAAAVSEPIDQEQQQQQDQQQDSQGSSDDFTGMTFEQRLEMLCAEDDDATESPRSGSAAAVPGDEGAFSQRGVEAVLQTPVLPSHVACVATQTSPLLVDAATQRTIGCNAATQVTPKPVVSLPTVTPTSVRTHRGWLAP